MIFAEQTLFFNFQSNAESHAQFYSGKLKLNTHYTIVPSAMKLYCSEFLGIAGLQVADTNGGKMTFKQ